MSDDEQGPIDAAAELMVQSSFVLALVGAGLSVESGIPTFRGPGGLWTRFGEPSPGGYQSFLEDPAAWWKGQLDEAADPARAEFRAAIDVARPNAGHLAMTRLEEIGVLKLTITQNVDNLHQEAGSRRVVEIHGNRTKVRCVGCEARWPRRDFSIEEYPPRCPKCGGLIKHDTVMFGEPIPPGVLETCFQETARCDCMILVGTSATVYPAAGFPESVKETGGCLIEANPNETPLTGMSDVVLRGSTSESLPLLVGRVEELLRQAKG